MKRKNMVNHLGNYKQPPLGILIRQAGFNALELMLVLAIIAIAIAVAIHVMAGNSDKQNSNQMISDVSGLMSNIHDAFASSSGGYTSLTTEMAIEAKLIPTDLRLTSDGKGVLNQFQGGKVDVAPGEDGDNFTITYTNVPSSVCNMGIAALAGSGFNSIAVNDTAVYDATTSATVDAADISSACKDTVNTLVFTAS
ncbi:MAG: prepilin-type N-terminal cleavage/methylation domain-containing protein [Burkholderiales bacterium]|nr:prepilin-type N-terminal cleavage/methylation domain-containing protein [Burkholderiales bacterium]